MIAPSTRIYPVSRHSFGFELITKNELHKNYQLVELGFGLTSYLFVDETTQEVLHTNYVHGFSQTISIFNSMNVAVGMIKITKHTYEVYVRGFHMFSIRVISHRNMIVQTISATGREESISLTNKTPVNINDKNYLCFSEPCYPSSKNIQLTSPHNGLLYFSMMHQPFRNVFIQIENSIKYEMTKQKGMYLVKTTKDFTAIQSFSIAIIRCYEIKIR